MSSDSYIQVQMFVSLVSEVTEDWSEFDTENAVDRTGCVWVPQVRRNFEA